MLIKWLYLYFAWVYKQWGVSSNDIGIGAVAFTFPITCTPYIVIAGCTTIEGQPGCPAVMEVKNNSCKIDVYQSGYKSNYRAFIIGY